MKAPPLLIAGVVGALGGLAPAKPAAK